jgi:ketosteroid isomerase-like protein
MHLKWMGGITLVFVAGLVAGHSLDSVMRMVFPTAPAMGHMDVNDNADLSGIEELHKLDVRVTLMNSAKALQQEWADGAVRILQDAPIDVGKQAIYASDVRSIAEQPGSAIVSYKPDIRDIHVAGDWAFEWGYFDAGFREGKGKPISSMHGKMLRVLRRENGQWKFFRIMVMWKVAGSDSLQGD